MHSPAHIAALEDARLVASIAKLADETLPVAGGIACYAGPDGWATQVVGAGLHGVVTGSDVDRTIDWYTERGVATVCEVSPYAHDSLLARLAERAFVVRGFETVLARAPERLDGLDDPRLVVERIDPGDTEALDQHTALTTEGFFEGAAAPSVFHTLQDRVAHHPRTVSFLARWDGQPAGVGAMEVAGEVACLFAATVLPRFRRRGVHAALLRRRVTEAASWGVAVVTIHSQPGHATERNVGRLGFVPVCTRASLVRRVEGLTEPP